MNNLIYLYSHHILVTVLLFMGLYLIFGPLPEVLHKTVYENGRMLMGFAFVSIPVFSLMFYTSSLPALGDSFATAFSLTTSYLIALLMASSLVILTGEGFEVTSNRFKMEALAGFFYPMPIWLVLLSNNSVLVNVVHKIMAVVMLFFVCRMIMVVARRYRKAINRDANYYADELEVNISWLRSLGVHLSILGVAACATAFFTHFNVYLHSFLLFLQLAMLFAAFDVIVRFAKNFSIVEKDYDVALDEVSGSAVEVLPAVSNISEEVLRMIKINLGKWIADKKFKEAGLTVRNVALDISTNRTYLSNYINCVHNCSFSVWLNNLRVTEAVEILKENPNMTVADLAHSLGFSSATTFSYMFKTQYGISPTNWKKLHGENKKV